MAGNATAGTGGRDSRIAGRGRGRKAAAAQPDLVAARGRVSHQSTARRIPTGCREGRRWPPLVCHTQGSGHGRSPAGRAKHFTRAGAHRRGHYRQPSHPHRTDYRRYLVRSTGNPAPANLLHQTQFPGPGAHSLSIWPGRPAPWLGGRGGSVPPVSEICTPARYIFRVRATNSDGIWNAGDCVAEHRGAAVLLGDALVPARRGAGLNSHHRRGRLWHSEPETEAQERNSSRRNRRCAAISNACKECSASPKSASPKPSTPAPFRWRSSLWKTDDTCTSTRVFWRAPAAGARS